MSSLASILARFLDRRPGIDRLAADLFSRLAIQRKITGSVVEGYVRKAIRIGVWRILEVGKRALLLVVRRFGIIRSRVLGEILRRIFVEIEIQTLRGRAILYGIVIILKSTIYPREILGNVERLLAIGISYLNNPPMYRYYG